MLYKINLLSLIFVVLFNTTKCQQPSYWQQQVNYKIDVLLNDVDNTLDGFVKMDYYNNSPDTLHYIWIHLWQNAYKNDKTAFSDQMLENGNTDFYFSNNEKRGYINRLDFKINGNKAKTVDHPQHQDIIKLILPQPLAPKSNCKIETPFHVKLPYNFSRGGHINQAYQITQWYPKPAVYDSKGWHAMPYLDQGEFYSEFGNYEVQISLPQNYAVAATGVLQEDSEREWLKNRKLNFNYNTKIKEGNKQKTSAVISSKDIKTLHFIQNNVHDFAWFADKNFITKSSEMQLPNGKNISINIFYYLKNELQWKEAIAFAKKAILTKCNWVGEYPYNIVSLVDNAVSTTGGMEYPTIALISTGGGKNELEKVINHEIGHNWFYSNLASNERDYAWLDEGINTYYDKRYEGKYINGNDEIKGLKTKNILSKKRVQLSDKLLLQSLIAIHKDQPINTSSANFSNINYGLTVYEKAAEWMQYVEKKIGVILFDSCMKSYFQQWSYKHPYPQNFKQILESVSGKNMDSSFNLLDKTGLLPNQYYKKNIKCSFIYNPNSTEKYKYIFVVPAIGYNTYDKLMLGLVLHNYTLPSNHLQYVFAPMFATGSKQIKGIGKISYNYYPSNSKLYQIFFGINASAFSYKQSLDTTLNNVYEHFFKIVPSLQFYFKHKPRSTENSWIDIKTYLIKESNFSRYNYIPGSDSSVSYPVESAIKNSLINQISFNKNNTRVLYPYNYQLQMQQGKGFYKINFNGQYFFNYSSGGGIKVRAFASKFGYLGTKNYDQYQYMPRLMNSDGTNDFTYNQYMLGRTAATSNSDFPIANKGLAAHQIMQLDGAFKLRLDPFGGVQGVSEYWVAALNTTSTLPKNILPQNLPLKLFLDIGTYNEAWKKNPPTSKFLYVGGFQLSIIKDIVTIYAPLIYSKDFKTAFKSVPELNSFSKRITFSINLQNISIKRIFSQIDFLF